MRQSRTIFIILFSVLGVLLLLFFYFSSDEKRYQWYESYRSNSSQPYGVLFMKQLLKSYRPDGKFVYNDRKRLRDLLDSMSQPTNTDYVFIGHSLHLNPADADALLDFVYSGNDAFISTLEVPADLIKKVYGDECDGTIEYRNDEVKSVTLNFYHDTLRRAGGYTYAYRWGAEDHIYYWNYVGKNAFCDSTRLITPLGYFDEKNVNFFRLKHGTGSIYLHSNPLVFTNYFLSKPDKLNYVSGVFSHLNGKDIIWDEFSKVFFTGNNNPESSPLSYILDQPSLKYAWWVMLGSIILYVLFAAKRTQRAIPIREPKSNTSLEYINLISLLHFKNSNHLDIARKKMRYFLYFIRAKYGIHAQTFTDQHVKKLSEKSKVSSGDIQIIFDQYYMIERHAEYNTATDKLVSLYYSIENFYKHCK